MIWGDLCVRCHKKTLQKKFPAVFLSDMIFGNYSCGEFWSWVGLKFACGTRCTGASSTPRCCTANNPTKSRPWTIFLNSLSWFFVSNNSGYKMFDSRTIWEKKSIKCHIGANLKRHFRQSAIAVNICWCYIIVAFSFSILSTYFFWEKSCCTFLHFSIYKGIFSAINTLNLWRFGPAGKFAKFTLCFIQTLHKCFPGVSQHKTLFKNTTELKRRH